MTESVIRSAIDEQGHLVAPFPLDTTLFSKLESALVSATHGQRHLLNLPPISELARSEAVRGVVEPVLGKGAFAVNATYFNKRPDANWKVTWHQDVMITVRERRNADGWGPWSEKEGVMHVRPPVEVMERMMALRVHLDDCGKDNGPLRVISRSHKHGYLRAEEIEEWRSKPCVVCTAERGDVLLMRPLLLHASSSAAQPRSRRVIHLEFAADDLPDGMAWHERVG